MMTQAHTERCTKHRGRSGRLIVTHVRRTVAAQPGQEPGETLLPEVIALTCMLAQSLAAHISWVVIGSRPLRGALRGVSGAVSASKSALPAASSLAPPARFTEAPHI